MNVDGATVPVNELIRWLSPSALICCQIKVSVFQKSTSLFVFSALKLWQEIILPCLTHNIPNSDLWIQSVVLLYFHELLCYSRLNVTIETITLFG